MKVVILAFAIVFSGCSLTTVAARDSIPCTRSYAAPITDAGGAVASAIGTGVMAHRAETGAEKRVALTLAISYLIFGYSAYRGVNSVDECRYK